MVSKAEGRFYFLARNSLEKRQKRIGKTNGEVRLLWPMEAQIHVGWQSLLEKVLTIHSKILDPLGRYIILKAEIEDKMYVLINVYAPNKDTNIVNFLNNLLMTLRKNDFDEEENIIIGGDFKCPPNPVLDKKGGLLIPRKSVVVTIDNLQEELDLVDIWRIKNPAKKSFTWSQNSPMIFCRLDYWLISNTLHDLVLTTDIIPAIKTDHAAISIDFCNRSTDINWKMNCSLLDDEDYINDIAAKIPIWLAEGRNELSDNRGIWDWMKYNIRAHKIQYSKKHGKETKDKKVFKKNTLKRNIYLKQTPAT